MGASRLKRPLGFTYLGVLFLIAIVGISAAAVAVLWNLEAQREREVELLFAGREFRLALQRYAADHRSQPDPYPPSLEDLLRDRKASGVRRYLRRIYVDPMTSSTDWGIVRSDKGGIVGVFSQSRKAPIKKVGFDPEEALFAAASAYSDWVFGPLSAPRSQDAFGSIRGPGSPAYSIPTGDSAGEQAPTAAPVAQAGSSPRLYQADRCALLAQQDAGTCLYEREHSGGSAGDACDASASTRMSACRAGQPLPRLDWH